MSVSSMWPAEANSMRFCIVLLCLYAAVTLEAQLSSKLSVENPSCQTKQSCDEMWEAPNLSDCIDNLCVCTGGSKFVERNLTCECSLGYVAGQARCLPAATELGSKCQENVQCKPLGELAICEAGECHYLSEYCDSDGECAHINKGFCRDNRCTCDEGHFAIPDKQGCLSKLKSLMDPCEQDIQCFTSFGANSSFCRTRCVCRDDFHEVNNSKCVKNRGQGEQCSSHSDCYVKPGSDSSMELTCVEGKCTGTTGQRTETKFDCDTGTHSCTSFGLSVMVPMYLSLNAFLRGWHE